MLNQLINLRNSKGQALVTLLFFVIIGITIISAEAIVLYTNILSASTAEQGMDAYYLAESGIEEGLIRLIRDPSYSGGSLTVGSGTVDIQVASGIITATGTFHNAIRKIQVTTANINGAIAVDSWEEI
ncbi:MAG: hypothetical protein AAB675_01555 [Patescibacteria group bacterium]